MCESALIGVEVYCMIRGGEGEVLMMMLVCGEDVCVCKCVFIIMDCNFWCFYDLINYLIRN